MKEVQILRNPGNESETRELLVRRCFKADTIFSRMKGLLGLDRLADDEALWIEPCNSIHTFFMKFPIDVVYLEQSSEFEFKVVKIFECVPAWRAHLPVWGARAVMELSAGGVARRGIRNGDSLCIR